MSIDVRYARPDEFPAIAELDGANFGIVYTPADIEDARLDVEDDRMLVATDSGRIVGVSCEVGFTMTVPGGNVPALGLTWVSVDVTHRRRGILRSLIEKQLRQAAAEGIPACILGASEGGIYGRYGFGVAGHARTTVIDRAAARIAARVDDHGVTRMTTAQARTVLPGIHDRWRRDVPGALTRNGQRWTYQLLDRQWMRGSRTEQYHLVHADGYLSYRIGRGEGRTGMRNDCVIVDYAVCTAQAHAALWQVLLGLDLAATITSEVIPIDDPLPGLLTDPRQVTTTSLADDLWLRPLDIAALLSARTYAVDVAVDLAVRDPLLGDATFRLDGAADGSACTRVDGAGDVTIGVADLGAVCLGGTRVAALARAGRVSGDPELIRRLDRALLADVLPRTGTHF